VNISQVSSIEGFVESGNINEEFIALILLPIVGNAAEHVRRMPHLKLSHGSWVLLPGHCRHGLIQESPGSCHERCSGLIYSDCALRHPIFGTAGLDYGKAAELM